MRQSMADVDRERWRKEGREEGVVLALRKTLLRQLRGRFGKVPKAIEQTIAATDDVARLEAWLTRFARATTLDEVGIEPEQ